MTEINNSSRGSKSSNDGSFEALNQIIDRESQQSQTNNLNSQSSDFQSIDKVILIDKTSTKSLGNQIHNQQKEQRNICVEQYQYIQKIEIQNKRKTQQIKHLNQQISQLLLQNLHLQEKVIFYKNQFQEFKKKQQQLAQFCKQETIKTKTANFKKKTFICQNNKQIWLTQQLNDSQLHTHSLMVKIQFFQQQNKKMKQWLQQYFKININSEKLKMNLSTLIQSAIVDFQSNLKQVQRQIELIVLDARLNGYQKIIRCKQSYNHWETLNYIESIKRYIENKRLNY